MPAERHAAECDRMIQRSRLAVNGGPRVRTRASWHQWPSNQERNLLRHLQTILKGSRWTVRARWTGHATFERQFSQAFGQFCRIRHVVTVPNGTSALSLALEG